MTPVRALGALALLVTVAQVATLWGGTLAVMAAGLLMVAGREESGR